MKGLKSLTDLKDDDLFMYTDGDELPRPELLQFLKLYDGYPQPIAFWYKWSIFGFFWHINETMLESYSAPIPSGKYRMPPGHPVFIKSSTYVLY